VAREPVLLQTYFPENGVKVGLNYATPCGETLTMLAWAGHKRIASVWWENEADHIQAKNSRGASTVTALALATSKGHTAVIQTLQ
jgi:hypothetical protein